MVQALYLKKNCNMIEIEKRVKGYMASVSKELKKQGKLRNVDKLSMDILESSLRKWLMAEKMVLELGILLPSDRGNMSKNPAIDVSIASLRQALGIMQDYGLTALSEKKLLRGETKGDSKSPFAAFLDDDQ